MLYLYSGDGCHEVPQEPRMCWETLGWPLKDLGGKQGWHPAGTSEHHMFAYRWKNSGFSDIFF